MRTRSNNVDFSGNVELGLVGLYEKDYKYHKTL